MTKLVKKKRIIRLKKGIRRTVTLDKVETSDRISPYLLKKEFDRLNIPVRYGTKTIFAMEDGWDLSSSVKDTLEDCTIYYEENGKNYKTETVAGFYLTGQFTDPSFGIKSRFSAPESPVSLFILPKGEKPKNIIDLPHSSVPRDFAGNPLGWKYLGIEHLKDFSRKELSPGLYSETLIGHRVINVTGYIGSHIAGFWPSGHLGCSGFIGHYPLALTGSVPVWIK